MKLLSTIATLGLVCSFNVKAATGYMEAKHMKQVILYEKLLVVGNCGMYYNGGKGGNYYYFPSFAVTKSTKRQHYFVDDNGAVDRKSVKEFDQIHSASIPSIGSYDLNDFKRGLNECEGMRLEYVEACEQTPGCIIKQRQPNNQGE